LFINTGSTTSPVLSSQGKIQANGVNIDVGANASAVVVDWNNDTKKDLIVGNEDFEVRVYLNSGTNAAPLFTNYTVAITNTSTLMRNSPEVYDLNRDGKKDLIVGEEFGYVIFYENIGTDAAPSFSNIGDYLMLDNGSALWVPYRAHIDLVDWNGNGAKDLIVGDNDGYFHLFINSMGSHLFDDPNKTIPTAYVLYQAHPNPFNPKTTIRYQLPHTSDIRLIVYNELGQKVSTLVNSRIEAGYHKVIWHGRNDLGLQMPSGVYFYRLEAGNYVETRKMVLMR
jgi:hypothetical protein